MLRSRARRTEQPPAEGATPYVVINATSNTAAGLVGTVTPAETSAADRENADHENTVNKASVLYVFDQLFNHGNLAVIDNLVKPDLIQHSPTKADGADGLRLTVSTFKAAYPESRFEVKRAIAEGDLVVLHSNVILLPGTKGVASVNFVRIEQGKLAEIWEVTQAVPESTVSGNDMFSTLSDPPVSWPDPSADAAVTKQIAGMLFTQTTIGRDITAFDRYAADPYYDHGAYVANGIAAAKQFFLDAFARYPESTIAISQVVAEGDLLALLYHMRRTPDDPGIAAGDFIRVRQGRAVEFWDVIQIVPPTSANQNTMF